MHSFIHHFYHLSQQAHTCLTDLNGIVLRGPPYTLVCKSKSVPVASFWIYSVCILEHLSNRISASLTLMVIRYLSSASHMGSEHDFAESWRKRSDCVYLTHPLKNEGWGIGCSFHLNLRLFIAPHLQ